jgi:hypothetical protein
MSNNCVKCGEAPNIRPKPLAYSTQCLNAGARLAYRQTEVCAHSSFAELTACGGWAYDPPAQGKGRWSSQGQRRPGRRSRLGIHRNSGLPGRITTPTTKRWSVFRDPCRERV